MSEKKKVAFQKKALSSANKSKIDLRKKEVEVPELNFMMELEEGEVAVMIVRQLTFDELIEIQQDQFNYMRNLVEGVVEAVASKEAVTKEVSDALSQKSSVAGQRLETIEKCLVDPKLTRSEVVYIAKMFPSVAVKLYTTIMDLTDKGADLKKNSTG